MIVHHTATVHVVALLHVARHLILKFALLIVDHVTVQLVALFLIVHCLLVGLAVAQFPLNVAVTVLSVIAYHVAFHVTVIVHHTATVHVVALLLLDRHLIAKLALVMLGAFIVQLVACVHVLYTAAIVHPLVVYHTLVAQFASNVNVYVFDPIVLCA